MKEKRFVVTKDHKTDAITYMEYEKIKGIKFNPKSNVKFEDMINVDKMVIINDSFIKKIIDKKCKIKLESILRMLSIIFENEDESGDAMDIALDELEKFKSILRNKYKEYMEKQKYELMLKKIEILENEIKIRKEYLYKEDIKLSEGKGR